MIGSFCMLMACTENKQDDSGKAAEETTQRPDSTGSESGAESAAAKTFTVRPGVRISFTESHPVGMSMSDVAVKLEGDANAETVFRDIDPVSEILESDLDNNGLKEWFIISVASGSGSYGNIKGITITKDDQFDEILIPDMNAGDGYRGHDTFSMQDGKLVRRFPVYQKDDDNSKPSGGEKEIRYSLKQFPGGKYALNPEN